MDFPSTFQSKILTNRTPRKGSNPSESNLSKFTSQQCSRKTTNLSLGNHEYSQLNFLQSRRESQLNSMFNIRKHKLDQITKANYAIYERINTQATHYPIKNDKEKDKEWRGPHSRFYTIQECHENAEEIRALGPIGNFKAFRTPQTDTTTLESLKENKQSKSMSLARLKTKKSKYMKKQDPCLPAIFQFY